MINSRNYNFSILFWLNKDRIQSNGEMPIYMRITVDGNRVEISSKKTVLPELWDQKAQQVKGKDNSIRMMNSYLDMTKNTFAGSIEIITIN